MRQELPPPSGRLGLCLSATVGAGASPVQVAQRLSDTQRIYRSAAGTVAQTRVEITETLHKDTGYEFRSVSCPVDDARLRGQMLGGGSSVPGEFHPFGTADSSGDFSSDHCNNLIK